MTRIETIDQFKATYPFYIDGRVEWSDMDSFGHVNNAMYISYFERVRAHFFEQEGIWGHKKKENIGPILASTSCKFILPLDYPDELLIGLTVEDVSEAGFVHQYGVYSRGRDGLAAFGDGKLVFTHYGTGGKVAIPAPILARIKRYLA